MADYLHGAYGRLDASIVQRVVASETVPVYFGTAPVGLVRGYEGAGAVNAPVRISSLADAEAKIGHSGDFARFTLCEAVAAHFDSGDDGVGPIYVVNVLDPARHRAAEAASRTVPMSSGRARVATDTAVLDTLRVIRPEVQGEPQEAVVRGTGPAGDLPEFDYRAAYEAAGVSLEGGVISYAPGSEVAPELLHGDHAYIGVTLTAPEGATAAVVSVNGEAGDELDLSEDSDDVFGGSPILYLAFATADGSALAPASWEVRVAWVGGSSPETACRISRGTADYVEGTDYELSYDWTSGCAVVSSVDGRVPDGPVSVAYDEVDPDAVTPEDVVGMASPSGELSGIAALPLVYQELFAVPNVLAAPGWSDHPAVYDALVAASSAINGHWDAIVACDLPLVDPSDGSTMVDTIEKAVAWKAENGYSSERAVACWPMAVDSSGRRFHLSTLFVSSSLAVDQGHGGVPFESPSNKSVSVARQFFGDNSPNRGFDQQTGNQLNARGVTTLVGWAGAQVLWGPHTAAYDADDPTVDPRATFASNMRMLMHVTNSFQLEWSPLVDSPMTRALRDRIVNREQEKLDALVSVGALIGQPRVSFVEAENPVTSLMEGDFRWDLEATPTPPMKSATVHVSYTDAGFASYFEEG